MKNSTEYPFEIQVGLSTVMIHNLEERIEFAQTNPGMASQVAPSKIDCQRQGIDYRLFFELEPWDEHEQRRFLTTMVTDADFRQAFRKIVGNAPAGGGQHG